VATDNPTQRPPQSWTSSHRPRHPGPGPARRRAVRRQGRPAAGRGGCAAV